MRFHSMDRDNFTFEIFALLGFYTAYIESSVTDVSALTARYHLQGPISPKRMTWTA